MPSCSAKSGNCKLHLDAAALLYLARVAAGDFRLRCIEELTAAGRYALLVDLRSIASPRLMAA